jgi:hypothetical protein
MLVVIAQDFRHRAVHWLALAGLFLLFFSLHFIEHQLPEHLSQFGLNLLFIGLQWSALTLYFSIRNKQFVNIMDRFIGWGDLLLFIVFAAAFSLPAFVFFMVGGLLFTLLAFALQHAIGKAPKLIPLAAWLAIFYLAQWGATSFFELPASLSNSPLFAFVNTTF